MQYFSPLDYFRSPKPVGVDLSNEMLANLKGPTNSQFPIASFVYSDERNLHIHDTQILNLRIVHLSSSDVVILWETLNQDPLTRFEFRFENKGLTIEKNLEILQYEAFINSYKESDQLGLLLDDRYYFNLRDLSPETQYSMCIRIVDHEWSTQLTFKTLSLCRKLSFTQVDKALASSVLVHTEFETLTQYVLPDARLRPLFSDGLNEITHLIVHYGEVGYLRTTWASLNLEVDLNKRGFDFRIENLKPASKYQYCCTCVSQAGSLDMPGKTCFWTKEVAPVLTSPLRLMQAGINSLTLSFDPVESDYHEIKGYVLQYTSKTSHISKFASGDPQETVLTDLFYSTHYSISGAVKSESGVGKFGPPLEAWTLPAAPDLALGQVVTTRHDGATLEFTLDEANLEVLEALEIRTFAHGRVRHGEWLEATVGPLEKRDHQVSVRVSGLLSLTQYSAQVRGKTPYGLGQWSEEIQFQTTREAPTVRKPKIVDRCGSALGITFEIDWLGGLQEDTPPESFDVKLNREIYNVSVLKAQSEGQPLELPYLVVIPNLPAETAFQICVRTRTAEGGFGLWSPLLETETLSRGPKIDQLYTISATHDSLTLGWEVSKESLSPPSKIQAEDWPPLANREVRGFSLGLGPYRRVFHSMEKTYVGINEIDHQVEEGFTRFTLKECGLLPETRYMLELRCDTAEGHGEIAKLNHMNTASLIRPPGPPELVYATPTGLTLSFSFDPESSEFTIFEVELKKVDLLQSGNWETGIRLNIQQDCTKISCDKETRYVASIGCLEETTRYKAQVRALSINSFTGWSAPSVTMKTEPGTENTLSLSQSPKPGTHSAEVEKAVQIPELEAKLEEVLRFVFMCARTGVNLPKNQIPTVEIEASQLLEEFETADAAVLEAVRRVRLPNQVATRNLVEFLVSRVPVAGVSALLLKELWFRIRLIALIAQLYGQDLDDPEIHMLMLTCLVPAHTGAHSASDEAGGFDSTAVFRTVAVVFAKEAFVRATGLRSLRHVFDGVASLFKLSEDSDEYKPQGDYESTRLSDEDFLANSYGTNGLAQYVASFEGTAISLFRPAPYWESTSWLVILVVVRLLDPLLSSARFFHRRILPIWQSEVHTNVGGLLLISWLLTGLGLYVFFFLRRNMGFYSNVPSTGVFVTLTVLPALSTFFATQDIYKALSSQDYFYLFLGFYIVLNGLHRQLTNLREIWMYDEQNSKIEVFIGQVSHIRVFLWRLILVIFSFEALIFPSIRELTGVGFRLSLSPESHNLFSLQTLGFALGILGAQAQEQFLETVQKRSVLLNLLGARKIILGSVGLLFTGVTAVTRVTDVIGFIRDVSPHPKVCCLVLTLREIGIPAGFLIACFGVLSVMLQEYLPVYLVHVFVALWAACLGSLLTFFGLRIWEDRKSQLQADYRIVLLLPHGSAQARDKSIQALKTSVAMGAKIGGKVATQWIAGRMANSAISLVGGVLSKFR